MLLLLSVLLVLLLLLLLLLLGLWAWLLLLLLPLLVLLGVVLILSFHQTFTPNVSCGFPCPYAARRKGLPVLRGKGRSACSLDLGVWPMQHRDGRR